MAEIVFHGETYRTADRIGLMALMRFAKVAKGGVDSADMAGLAAIYDLLQQCLADEEWARFEAHADRVRADDESLMQVVADVMEAMTARPTQRPSDSSAGPPATPESSTAGSSSRVIERLEQQGRPDLALLVTNAQESRTA